MAVGIPITKGEIDNVAGVTAKEFQHMFERVAKMKEFLDGTPDIDLTALGYTAGEVANLKTAFTDLNQLKTIWEGTANLAVAKNFTTFVRRLWGIGSF